MGGWEVHLPSFLLEVLISIQPFSAPLKVQNLASASALVCLAFIVVM